MQQHLGLRKSSQMHIVLGNQSFVASAVLNIISTDFHTLLPALHTPHELMLGFRVPVIAVQFRQTSPLHHGISEAAQHLTVHLSCKNNKLLDPYRAHETTVHTDPAWFRTQRSESRCNHSGVAFSVQKYALLSSDDRSEAFLAKLCNFLPIVRFLTGSRTQTPYIAHGASSYAKGQQLLLEQTEMVLIAVLWEVAIGAILKFRQRITLWTAHCVGIPATSSFPSRTGRFKLYSFPVAFLRWIGCFVFVGLVQHKRFRLGPSLRVVQTL